MLIDNYSRYVLNATVSCRYSAKTTFDNLSAGFKKHNINKDIKYRELYCDGGIENKGIVDDLLNGLNIKKVIAQKEVIFSNSMVEAVNKRIKYDFLYWQHFDSFQALELYLPTLLNEYNNKPHSSLFGFTPQEVFVDNAVPSQENFKVFLNENLGSRNDNNRANVCVECKNQQ